LIGTWVNNNNKVLWPIFVYQISPILIPYWFRFMADFKICIDPITIHKHTWWRLLWITTCLSIAILCLLFFSPNIYCLVKTWIREMLKNSSLCIAGCGSFSFSRLILATYLNIITFRLYASFRGLWWNPIIAKVNINFLSIL